MNDTSTLTFHNGTSDDAACILSPRAALLSTVLTTFASSIISGVSSGHFVAFYTAWICWLASLRIVIVAVWQIYEAVRLRPIVGGDQFFTFLEGIPVLRWLFSDARSFNDPFFREHSGRVMDYDQGQVTALGWFGWVWAACYAPVVQTLWLVKNWDSDGSPWLFIVRGLGVGVVALPLTMDVRGRYGRALGHRLGRFAQAAFTGLATVGLAALAGLSVTELLLGVVRGALGKHYWIVALYFLIMVFWTKLAFVFASPHDEPYSAGKGGGVLAGFAMGCFGGIFVAAPAFAMMMASADKPGLAIGGYIGCESVAWWEKATAIMP
ncbi:hypothetical protein QBC42DRAFT_348501 [Cladorrhinum samala]|uniref:Uncharacterized protein n=1 Tax=Cladorrhinum samala TaxID=585594 RepID=A0AAV9HKE4_9PEZI|nr:hypothetical protein QBC42DRAFT_348501 [Cladorrhinum samala]